MLEKQTIALSLPKNILRKAKVLAIEHETSVSGLLTDLLTNLIEREDRCQLAKKDYFATLSRATNLATDGEIGWSRDSLHER